MNVALNFARNRPFYMFVTIAILTVTVTIETLLFAYNLVRS